MVDQSGEGDRSNPMSDSSSLYESDFYSWTIEQVKSLQEGRLNCLDIPNLIEEIESLGREERQELEDRLGVLLGHLLKWDFQPTTHRSNNWLSMIRNQRRRFLRVLKQSPSLEAYMPEAIAKAYESALNVVVGETPLNYKDFPPECPYSQKQILDLGFPYSP